MADPTTSPPACSVCKKAIPSAPKETSRFGWFELVTHGYVMIGDWFGVQLAPNQKNWLLCSPECLRLFAEVTDAASAGNET